MKKSKYHYWTIAQAYHHAVRKIPLRWYERRGNIFLCGIAFSLTLAGVQAHWFDVKPHLWFSLVGIACYVFGYIGDAYSTYRVVRMKPEFDRYGVEFPVRERNPFLSKHPALRDQFHLRAIWPDFMMLVGVWFVPIVGIGNLTYRLCAVLNNLRKEQRLLLLTRMMTGGTNRQERGG